MCCTLMLWLSLITLLPSVLPSTEPDLPAPKNVHMDSYNMKHVVRWDAVEVEDVAMPVMYNVGFEMDDPITGTAEQNLKYRGRYSTFLELCVNITKTECDCTEQILPIYRGKPMVRAELGSRRSDWVLLSDFQPSTNTTIGPVKSLVLHSHSGQLTVDFSPPFSLIPSNWQMRYKLTYWKESSIEKVTVDPSFATSYALDNLELNTNYCVQVRAFTHYIEGLASDPVCATTVTDVTLILVLGCVFGFLLICGVIALLIIPDRPLHLARAKIKTWLDGPYSIPSDIKDYLEDPPHSIPEDCGAQNTTEEHYDTVSIVCMDSSQNITVELLPDPRRPASEKT